jgi:hypothetical protein
MKTFILSVTLLAVSFTATADQRFESWQGLCHFAYDVNDKDNEVYFANCLNSINTYDANDGQGRLAYGTSKVTQIYKLTDYTIPQFKDVKLKGVDAAKMQYPNNIYKTALNTLCVMVTSNYDAGNDDNNETVYNTNDWNLEIDLGQYDYKNDEMIVTYTLDCRRGIAQ